MGSFKEINDTLKITTEQGFPADILDLKRHQASPIPLSDVEGKVFEFRNKPEARIYHSPPIRTFLVHYIDSKWLYWGHALIIEQTIHGEDPDNQMTSGKFKIIKLYDPEYQILVTKNESIAGGKSYF